MSMGRRVRACTRLSGPAKALTTRDYVRGISGLSTLLNKNCNAPDTHEDPRAIGTNRPLHVGKEETARHDSLDGETHV
jgi:hypothetical protein